MGDVFPHDELFELDYTHVQFAKDPAGHLRKCSNAQTQSESESVLRSVCKKGLLVEQGLVAKEESEGNGKGRGRREADWFSVYGRSDVGVGRERDGQSVSKFEWAAEFMPVQMERKEMHFMLLPRQGQGQRQGQTEEMKERERERCIMQSMQIG